MCGRGACGEIQKKVRWDNAIAAEGSGILGSFVTCVSGCVHWYNEIFCESLSKYFWGSILNYSESTIGNERKLK